MRGEDIVKMSKKEMRRIGIIHKVMDKLIKQEEAGSLLGLTSRQIRRIIKRVKQEGDIGIVHRSRGRESNRRISKKIRRRVIALYKARYWDFGPTLASEKLEERDGIRLSDETLRLWLIEEGIWKKGRKAKEHRQWRERKACFGQMVQIDGSHHDWLEGRGPKLVLMGYIDDATGQAYGRFYDYEGTIPALDSFMRYVKLFGIPQSVYVDRHTTYKSPKKNIWEEEKTLSEFEKALERLQAHVIHAESPQAKGRIERLFRTFQDRLIKEMRLANVRTKEEANAFLESYLPRFNMRFERKAKSDVDLHREVPEGIELERALSIQVVRVLRNDNTVQYEGKFYQLQKAWTRRPKTVTLEVWVDGSLHMRDRDRALEYFQIEQPEKRVTVPKVKGYCHMERIPSQDHPWRRFSLRKRRMVASVPGTTHLKAFRPKSSHQDNEDSRARSSLLSTYSQNSQREKKEAKKRERTAAILFVQQNKKPDISIHAFYSPR